MSGSSTRKSALAAISDQPPAVHALFRPSAYGTAMHDHPPKDLAGIVASLVFVAALVVLALIGAILLIPF